MVVFFGGVSGCVFVVLVVLTTGFGCKYMTPKIAPPINSSNTAPRPIKTRGRFDFAASAPAAGAEGTATPARLLSPTAWGWIAERTCVASGSKTATFGA